MTAGNTTTKHQEPPVLGVALPLPKGRDQDISVILRVIMILDEMDETERMIKAGDLSQTDINWLLFYRRNWRDVAARVREVLSHV